MEGNLTKGDVVIVTHSAKNRILRTNGIFLEGNEHQLVVGHNFKETKPLDVTTIQKKDVIGVQCVAAEDVRE